MEIGIILLSSGIACLLVAAICKFIADTAKVKLLTYKILRGSQFIFLIAFLILLVLAAVFS